MPDPASSLMLELIENTLSKKAFLRFNYNGTYINLCGLKGENLPEKFDCTVEKFYKLIDENVLDQIGLYEMCQNVKFYDEMYESKAYVQGNKIGAILGSYFAWIAVIIFGTILTVFLIALCICKALRKNNTDYLMQHNDMVSVDKYN